MSDKLEYVLGLNKEGFKKGMEQSIDQAKELKNTLLEILGIGAGLEFLKGSAEAFITAQKSADNLSESLRANGGTIDSLKELNELNEKLEEKGIFSHVQSEQAEAFAEQAGLTTEQIKKLIPIAEDWAARTGKSVEDATRQIVKGTFGASKELKLLGIEMSKHNSRAQNLANIEAGLTKRTGGANEEIAENTEAGKIANLKNQFESLKEEVGRDLLAIFEKARPFLIETINNFKLLVHWIESNKNMLLEAGKVIVIGIGIWKSLTAGIWLAEEAELAFAAANPFSLILIGATALLTTLGLINGSTQDAIDKQRQLKAELQKDVIDRAQTNEYDKEVENYKNLNKIKSELTEKQLDDAMHSATQHIFDEMQVLQGIINGFDKGDVSKATEDMAKVRHELDVAEEYRKNYFTTKRNKEQDILNTPSSKETARENIVINITKLVEKLELHSLNVKEGATEIKDIIAQTLLEAMSSVKLLSH